MNSYQSESTNIEIIELVEKYQDSKDMAAREKIVKLLEPLVKKIVRLNFGQHRELWEDLEQEGNLGLLKAIELFDESKNTEFKTYAVHMIKGAIKHYLRDKGDLIRKSAHVGDFSTKVERLIQNLTQNLERIPTDLEIAEVFSVDESKINLARKINQQLHDIISIENEYEDNGGSRDCNLVDLLGDIDPNIKKIDEYVDLYVALKKLNDYKPLLYSIIWLYFFQDLSQEETANRLRLSQNNVSHLLKEAISKLKKILIIDVSENSITFQK